MRYATHIAVLTYIAAAAAANLLAAKYGPSVLVINALLLIGLDLVLRDYVHDRAGRHWPGATLALVTAGSFAAWVVNPDAGRIAVASALAFGLAGIADGIVYVATRNRPWLVRSNTSNVAGAAVDSIAFPLLAFGAVAWPIILPLFVAKVVGAAAWSIVIDGVRRRAASHHI